MNVSGLSSPVAVSSTSVTSNAKVNRSDGDADDQGAQQISPMAQDLTKLQQLQQSDPEKFKALMSQISQALQSEAQSQQQGATAIGKVADAFGQAAQTGQMPAIGKGGGHHHHHHAPATTAAPGAATGAASAVAAYNQASPSPWKSVEQTISSVLSSAGV